LKLTKAPRKHGRAKSSKSKSHGAKLYSQSVVLIGAGSFILFAVFNLNARMQLDSVLVASQAIYNVIGGVSGLLLGVKQLGLGLAQLAAFMLLAILIFTAVLSIGSGVIKLLAVVSPKFSFLWPAILSLMRSALRLLGISDHAVPPRSSKFVDEQLKSVKLASNKFSVDDLAA
jgi:hypothetical protein